MSEPSSTTVRVAAPEASRRGVELTLVRLGLRVVLVAAVLGVAAGLLDAVTWRPSSPEPLPADGGCTDPPCFGGDGLPGLRQLPLVLAPLGFLLAAAMGAAAVLAAVLGRRRGRAALLLAALGPVLVLVSMEIVPHALNPCLLAGALAEQLPPGCARTTHGVDVANRLHMLHHAVVGGVPAALGYRALIDRSRLGRRRTAARSAAAPPARTPSR